MDFTTRQQDCDDQALYRLAEQLRMLYTEPTYGPPLSHARPQYVQVETSPQSIGHFGIAPSPYAQFGMIPSSYNQFGVIPPSYNQSGVMPPTYTQVGITPQPGTIGNDRRHQNQQWSRVVGDGRADDIDDLKTWKGLFKKSNRKPPGDYICHNCLIKGHHYVKQCPRALPEGIKCTPYQGSKSCTGEFFCPKCHRYWLSHRSYSNTTEKCKKCKQEYFPIKQYTTENALKCGLYEKTRYRKYKAKFAGGSSVSGDSCQGLDSASSTGDGDGPGFDY